MPAWERPVSISFTRSYPARGTARKKSRDNTRVVTPWAANTRKGDHGETEKRSGCTIFDGAVGATTSGNAALGRVGHGWIVELDTLLSGAWNIVFLVRILSRTRVFNAFHSLLLYVRDIARGLLWICIFEEVGFSLEVVSICTVMEKWLRRVD